MATKNHKVELSTFRKWGKCDIIGYKTIKENDRTFVNFVWHKVCAEHKEQLQLSLKGNAKILAVAFANGTSNTNSYTKRLFTFKHFPSKYELLF